VTKKVASILEESRLLDVRHAVLAYSETGTNSPPTAWELHMPKHHDTSRLNRRGRHWEELESLPERLLTPSELRQRRAELASEMIALLLGDEELTRQPRQVLLKIYATLGTIKSQL
jgi:hypothetical protein